AVDPRDGPSGLPEAIDDGTAHSALGAGDDGDPGAHATPAGLSDSSAGSASLSEMTVVETFSMRRRTRRKIAEPMMTRPTKPTTIDQSSHTLPPSGRGQAMFTNWSTTQTRATAATGF